jgi:hypothetical protein
MKGPANPTVFPMAFTSPITGPIALRGKVSVGIAQNGARAVYGQGMARPMCHRWKTGALHNKRRTGRQPQKSESKTLMCFERWGANTVYQPGPSQRTAVIFISRSL